MAAWQHRLIYFRDFAYPSQPHRSRMPNSDIGDAPAGSFAAYVNGSVTTLPTPPLDPLDRIHKTALVAEELGAESGSDSEQGSKSSSRRSSSDSTRRHSHSRPTLAHRIYTQNLRVQANAKSLRARLLSGPLVDIYVGHSKKHWSLHRNLLCHHSEYLTHELLPTSENEDPESSIDLPDDDPSGFELLVKWLYQGKLDDVSNISDPYQQYDYAVACHALWLICDRFDMPQLKNLAIDQFRQGLYEAELVPDAEEINFIYRKSKKGSPFRRLMTKIAARQIMDPHANKDATSYLSCFRDDPEFAVELVNTIKNDSGGMLFEDPTESGDACIYHDHHDSPDCHQKGKPRTGTQVATSVKPVFKTNFHIPRNTPVPPTQPDTITTKPDNATPKLNDLERDRTGGTSDTTSDPANIFLPIYSGDSPQDVIDIDSVSLAPEPERRSVTFARSPKRNPTPPKLRRRKTDGVKAVA